MGSDHPQGLGILIIIRCHHSTLAGGEVLRSVEAEAGHIRDGSDAFSIVHRPMSLGRVLDYNNSLFLAQLSYGLQVDRIAVEIRWKDRFRSCREGFFNTIQSETIGITVNISENRSCTRQHDRISCSD